jgi:hypothetical protein
VGSFFARHESNRHCQWYMMDVIFYFPALGVKRSGLRLEGVRTPHHPSAVS